MDLDLDLVPSLVSSSGLVMTDRGVGHQELYRHDMRTKRDSCNVSILSGACCAKTAEIKIIKFFIIGRTQRGMRGS